MIVQSNKKLMLDFVTVVENEAQLITEGLSAEEQATEDMKSYYVGKGYKAKSEREAAFPLHLLERGYSIDITKANASREDDKKAILNTIAGGVAAEDLTTQEPDLSSIEFSRVNRRLQGMFAEPAINKAAKNGRLQTGYRWIRCLTVWCWPTLSTLECLEKDVEREELRLDFRGCDDLAAFSVWDGLGKMQGLVQLFVEDGKTLLSLPDGMCDLAHLKVLNLKDCSRLSSLPSGECHHHHASFGIILFSHF